MTRLVLTLLLVLWATLAQAAVTGTFFIGGTKIMVGTGSPEAAVTGNPGDQFNRTDDGTLWVKNTGTGNTGWVQVATSAGGGAPTSAGYWLKTADATLSNEFAMGGLATGLVKNTTTTGVPTIAVQGTDYFGPGANAVPTASATFNLGSSTFKFNDAYLTRLSVGSDTPSFTGPTRVLSVLQTYTGTLGSTIYTMDYGSLLLTPTGSAYTGTARASERYVFATGSQNLTEVEGSIFGTGLATSGTVSTNGGFIAATNRTAGPSTTEFGIRVDRTVNNGGSVTGASAGISIGPITTTGGTAGTVVYPRGLVIADQTTNGQTNALQIESNHQNSGYWHLFSDGKFDGTSSYVGGATSGYHWWNRFSVATTPSANTPGEAWVGLHARSLGYGTHNVGTLIGGYLDSSANDTVTVDSWNSVTGGGVHAGVADVSHYGTGTVSLMSGFTSWGGMGTGSVATNLYRFYVPQLYQYDGTVTTHVGLQIDDQSTGASGITNNWLIRAQAPSSKDFAVRADGVMKLGGVLYTFPASDASGCLQSNGSGALSWGSCAGVGGGYTAVADEGTSLTARSVVNFIGTGVTCVDNAGATRTDCTVSGGGGGTFPGSATDNAITRFDGTGGSTVQNSAITVDDTGALGLPDGVKQTFNPNGTTAGLNVGAQAGDPSTPANGDLWYDSTANELTGRINGANVALGAGGGSAALTGAYSALPAAGTVGRVFYCTDCPYAVMVDNGTTWDHYLPHGLGLATLPVSGSFTRVNAGSETVSTTTGAMVVTMALDGADTHRLWVKTAPATPYTITAIFQVQGIRDSGSTYGLTFRQSGDGKIAFLSDSSAAAGSTGVCNYNSATSFNTCPYSGGIRQDVSGYFVVRISDNGTNRLHQISHNGRDWITLYTIARTTFLTADQVGFEICNFSSTIGKVITLLSWKEN